MSRVGKMPIKVAQGVKINWSAPNLEVQGKGGKLSRTLPDSVDLNIEGDVITVINKDQSKSNLHGLSRALVNNMVIGVSEGYEKKLELIGVGYRAQAKGKVLALQLGFSHPVDFELPEGVSAKVDANTKVTLSGADKELLGEVAAKIRKIRPPEPYKGKGVRYAGEQISLKQGKAAGK